MKHKYSSYYEQVSILTTKILEWEDKILSLALTIDERIKDPEKLRKIDENLFRLWEAVAHCKCNVAKLETVENEHLIEQIEGQIGKKLVVNSKGFIEVKADEKE